MDIQVILSVALTLFSTQESCLCVPCLPNGHQCPSPLVASAVNAACLSPLQFIQCSDSPFFQTICQYVVICCHDYNGGRCYGDETQLLLLLQLTNIIQEISAEDCLKKQHCSNCSSTTEYCITDCFPGYFDLKCMSPCSKNCKNSKCSQKLNGIPMCSEGCVLGFYGTQCNIPCPISNGNCTKCPHGCDGQFCNNTSICVSGCPDSYYGSDCKTCSRRCRHCNRITGRCEKCHDPYSGGDCQFSCEYCSTTDCVQTCAPGLYGHSCSQTCKNCLAYPVANTNTTLTTNSFNSCTSECQRYSGECIHGCVDGLSRTNCSLKIQWKNKTSTPDNIQCNSNCIGCNTTGACVEGCSPGYYGDDCKPCSGTCFNHTCHPHNGTCDNGCIQGQYGQFCTLSCINCPGATCHPSTGICDEGPSPINYATIGTSTALVFFVFGIIITVFIFHCKRVSANSEGSHHMGVLRQQGDRQGDSSKRYRMSEHIYNEVNEDEMGPVIVFL